MGTTTRTRLPGLDVLRGLAIALVLVRHAFPTALGNAGIVGVVIFFTLSGYLITGVLLTEWERTGRIAFAEFFRRRALRLYPPLLLLLAVFSAVELATDRLHDRWYLGKTLVTALTYTSDLPLLPISPGLAHLWTLAIEEQFYLVWPVLLVLGLRRWRLSRMILVLVVGCWLTTAVTVWIFSDDVGHLYKLPTSWVLTLLTGAAARLFRDRLALLLVWPRLLGGLGLLVCLAIAAGPEGKGAAVMYLVGGPVIGVATVLMIVAVSRWTTLPPLLVPGQLLGVISYAVYLWNYLIVCWVRGNGSSPVTPAAGLIGTFGALGAATVSWFALERPIKNRWGSRRPVTEREPGRRSPVGRATVA